MMTQQALNDFPSSGGSVINLSSIVSKNPQPNSAIYSATKGAAPIVVFLASDAAEWVTGERITASGGFY